MASRTWERFLAGGVIKWNSPVLEYVWFRPWPFVLGRRIDVFHFTLCRPVKDVPCLMQKRLRSCRKSSDQNQSRNQTNRGGQSSQSSSRSLQPDRRGINRLWAKLTEAIKNKDMEAATDAKTAVEDGQRESTRRREAFGVRHEPRFFKMENDGRWVPRIQ